MMGVDGVGGGCGRLTSGVAGTAALGTMGGAATTGAASGWSFATSVAFFGGAGIDCASSFSSGIVWLSAWAVTMARLTSSTARPGAFILIYASARHKYPAGELGFA